MSREYDLYLQEHKANVAKGFQWMKANTPNLLGAEKNWGELEWQICNAHDASKNDSEEYNAYDAYFYGGNRSFEVVNEFNYAWIRHIHHNPHHWQSWILHSDEPEEAIKVLPIPHNYIIEMICDWWSFSWKTGDLYEIFNWYKSHKDYMMLAPETRFSVEIILEAIKQKLDEAKENTRE